MRPFSIKEFSPSRTVQASKNDCDINKIIARVAKGMDITHINQRAARYGDFSNVPSYQEALDLVSRAQGMFNSMSSKVRERFHNSPAEMIAFLQDESNREEAEKLGLVKKKEKPVPVVPPTGSIGAPVTGGAPAPAAGAEPAAPASAAGDVPNSNPT